MNDSGNLRSDRPASKLWDGCYDEASFTQECTAGNANISSFFVNFDFGQSYNLTKARLFGDADGVWVSNTWDLQTRNSTSDAWTTVFSGANAFMNDWSEKSISVTARYARVTVKGNPSGAGTQAREFELF